MSSNRFDFKPGFAVGENEEKLVKAREVAEWGRERGKKRPFSPLAVTSFFSFYPAAEPVHRLGNRQRSDSILLTMG